MTLEYLLPTPTRVRLEILDVRGRRVATLIDEVRPAGRFRAVWDGSANSDHRSPSGVYFARLDAGNDICTRKIVLIQ